LWQLLAWVAQSVDNNIDLGPAIQSLGIGSLIAVPAWVICWQLWKRLGEAQERERELSDRLGPLLAQSVDVLAKAPGQFDRALAEATTSTRSSEVDALMRRLEREVERLQGK
jgi:hypothetical protein